jgi:hypothetical protein
LTTDANKESAFSLQNHFHTPEHLNKASDALADNLIPTSFSSAQTLKLWILKSSSPIWLNFAKLIEYY